MMPRHNCAVRSCSTLIPVQLFLCWHHWVKVPQSVRDLVEAARKEMSRGYGDLVISDYREAKDAAIEAARAAAAKRLAA